MTASQDTLLALTQAILSHFNLSDNRVDAHAPEESEPEDVIFLEKDTGSDLTEGKVLCVQRTGEDTFSVSLESAHCFGGWPTHWTSQGASREAILKELASII
jgi:hypothetical protein